VHPDGSGAFGVCGRGVEAGDGHGRPLSELPIPEKVKLDVVYLQRQSLWFDIRILWLTFVKVLRRDGVSH